LICCSCKERNGACIQCSVKACKTAFHVTCAITDKLEMKTVLVEDKNTEDVKLKVSLFFFSISFCLPVNSEKYVYFFVMPLSWSLTFNSTSTKTILQCITFTNVFCITKHLLNVSIFRFI